MEIPAQLRDIIDTLSSEESEEMERLIEGFLQGDAELKTLMSDNLEPLIQVLSED